jgi:hypothetical protein
MRICNSIGNECSRGNHLITCPRGDCSPTDILAERSPQKLNADALSETRIDEWEFLLPCFNGELGKLINNGQCRVGATVREDGLYLFAALGKPIRVGGEIGEKPAGVDAAVKQASEESTNNELREAVNGSSSHLE